MSKLWRSDAQGVRVLGEVATENCPLCSAALVHAALAGERILYCGREQCSVNWLDYSELDRAARAADNSY